MTDEREPAAEPARLPPLSDSYDPIRDLIKTGVLEPPSRPGLLASLDRFEILRFIGAGGMGAVLLAFDPRTAQEVAIKILKPGMVHDPRAVHRFLVEARHMQRLSHPNILKVLEVSDREQGPYFVVPFMARGSLSRIVKPGRTLSPDMVLAVGLQIAEAVSYAHRRGIIHRDLKPDNVLIDGEGNACLSDFGLVRTVFNDSFLDVEHSHCEGTAPYMSPGVAAGEAEDTRCDIYSFGAMLYELLTGRRPYEGESVREALKKILAGPPPPIRQLNPDAPSRLVKVVEGAMARELRDRYAQMSDVAADLRRIQEGEEPVGPHKPPGGSPSVATRRWLWPAVAICVLLVLAGAAALLWPRARKTAPRNGIHEPPGVTDRGQPPGERQAPPALPQKARPRKEITLPGGVKMWFALIPEGRFMMGSNWGYEAEKPLHQVHITRPFYIGVYEVTNAQYAAFLRDTGQKANLPPSDSRPANVSWMQAQAFCEWLSRREGATCRLPTEAEWEYACRAGTTTEYYWGASPLPVVEHAWCDGNSRRTPQPVGLKKPNAWGLYDMLGNVWEWCRDWHEKDYYSKSPLADPRGPEKGTVRVIRGGSWGNNGPASCRSAMRNEVAPDAVRPDIGFRVVMEAPAGNPSPPAYSPRGQ